MKQILATNLILAGLCISGTSAFAQPTFVSQCPKGHQPAVIDVTAKVSTSAECPLLQDKHLRKLVDKNFYGTVFAWPAVPGTCLSGRDLEGSVGSVAVTGGTTESAQRIFPEALAVNPGNGGLVLIGGSEDGVPFLSGAAATVVSLQGEGLDLQLVLSDRFTVNLATGADTEDFEVVGANGASVTGRLAGQATIAPGAPFDNVEFTVQGSICIK
jgi:hypothetical protein